ncbi:hypothetical protein C8J57DRAFT_1718701 [Mycena rebaudengoi]|nr:hypothetical protein C8J57DRAFT_1718701 [Mycena rebaudengoi]
MSAASLTTKRLISKDGTEILAEATSNYAKPHIVFVHGFGCTGAAFDPIFNLDVLTENLYMVRYDTTRDTAEAGSHSDRRIMNRSITLKTRPVDAHFARGWPRGFELLLDSDSEPELDARGSDLEVLEVLRPSSRSSSTTPFPAADPMDFDSDSEEPDAITGAAVSPRCSSPIELSDTDDIDANSKKPATNKWRAASGATNLVDSDTVWQDDGSSGVRIGEFRPTKKALVQRMEYRDGPASVYPIHRVRTGIVVDLSNEKYHFCDPETKEPVSLISIILKSDNDSWDWGGWRRSCWREGVHACNQLDKALRTDVRFELDPTSRDAVIAAQQDTRRREGNTPEERAALFMKVIRDTKCHAVDSKGKKCHGGPILKEKGSSRGHNCFIGCTGWKTNWQDRHLFLRIPDHVNEDLVAKALAGAPLTDDASKDTPPCSAIIHPHIGLKKKKCSHAHIVNGVHISGVIENYSCKAQRYIYIPKDQSIRKALIVHALIPHSHPMPMLMKPSLEVIETYRRIIAANGVLGATVAKIDNAPSTKLLLNGKTPSAHDPALHNKRLKQGLIHAAKLEQYPNGLGVDAIRPMYHAELTKPLPERYIHGYIETNKGEIIIVTFVPFLLKLLDDPGVTSFDGDTTFKGIKGNVNEWELSIFAKLTQRAASVLRAYITGASADFFELLFDELQRVKLMVTGKPLPLKAFVPGGNLLVTNVDMDAAQVIGLCRSVMKHNDPNYSGIPNDTPPELVAPYFIKICWRHGKEPVHDFRALVSLGDFDRLMDFVYIDSKESLHAFSSFVYGLKIKKITDWWKHKEMHEWIIPCFIKSDSTPSTTNTNEAQHHWTNTLTGIGLAPVEALESRHVVDTNFCQEVQMTLRTGILANPNNEGSHRMARNSQRQSTTARKALESRTAVDESREIQNQIDAEIESRRASTARTNTLQVELKAAKSKAGKQRKSVGILSASSSGRVKTRGGQVAPVPVRTQSPTPTPLDDTPPAAIHTENFAAEFAVATGSNSSQEFDLDIASLLNGGAAIGSSFPLNIPPTFQFPTFDPFFDPALFGFTASEFNTLIPLPSDPALDELMSLWEGSGTFPQPDFDASAFDHLPLLPPPPPVSPPPMALAVEQPEPGPSAPKSRRGPRQEVDVSLILPTDSKRVRGPSELKRRMDGDEILDRVQKRAK